jgi:hypothetical protein
LLDLERTQALEDREALLKSKVQLELSVSDLEESQLSEQDYTVCNPFLLQHPLVVRIVMILNDVLQAKIAAEQQSIDAEIATKENELATILPQYDEIMAQATSLQKEYDITSDFALTRLNISS